MNKTQKHAKQTKVSGKLKQNQTLTKHNNQTPKKKKHAR